MAKAVIGALRVNLGMNSAQFQKGVSKAEMSAKKFARNVAVAMAGVTAAATGAFMAVRGAAERADEAYKAAQSLGMPVEDLTRLQHAAEMSGASFQDLQTGMRKGSQSIVAAVRGMTGESTKAFEDIGVSVKKADGTAKSINEVIGDVAEQFSKMPDGVKKTNAAMAIFGRSGTALIPMLNTGREGLKAMGDEAERLGLVFSGETGRASEIFNDNLARLSKTFTGLWNRVLANVVPSLASLTNRFVDASMQGGALDSAVKGISAAMNILAKAVVVVFDNLHHLYDLFKVFVAAKIVGFVVSAGKAFIMFAKAIRTAGIAAFLFTKISRAKITAILLIGAAVAKATGKLEDFTGWLEDMGRSLMNALPENIKGGIESLTSEFGSLGDAIVDTDVALSVFGDRAVDVADNAASSFGSIGTKGKSAVKAVGAETDKLSDKMKSFHNSAKSAFGEIGSSIRGLIDGSKSWRDVLADILTSFGRMMFQNTNFGGGLGGNILQGLFGGLFGFAKGGTIMPGGTGGIDSQLVMFRKSPNERVDITKPGQTLTSGGVDGTLQIMLAPGLKAEWLGEANQNTVQIVQPLAKSVADASRKSDRSRY